MSNEPEKNIEKLLKAYARKRKEEAGPSLELPPVTRQLFQAEVRRLNKAGGRPTPRTPAGLARWWPIFAWSSSAIALVLLVSLTYWENGRKPETVKLVQGLENKTGRSIAPNGLNPPYSGASLPKDSNAEGQKFGEQKSMLAAGATALPSASQVIARSADRQFRQPPPERSFGLQLEEKLMSKRLELGKELQPEVSDKTNLTLARNTARGIAPSNVFSLAPPTAPQVVVLTIREPKKSPDQKGDRDLRLASGRNDDRVEADEALAKSSSNMQLADPTRGVGTVADGPSGGARSEVSREGEYTANFRTAGELGQRFIRLDAGAKYRRNFNSPASPDILNSFKMIQTGDQIRIVDADGSTYEGHIRPIEGMEQRLGAVKSAEVTQRSGKDQALPRLDEEKRSPGQASGQPGAIENFAFRAIGTNRTLQQMVVFDGSVEPAPGPANAAEGTASRARAQQAVGGALRFYPVRMSGQAVIGATNQIRVEAVSREP